MSTIRNDIPYYWACVTVAIGRDRSAMSKCPSTSVDEGRSINGRPGQQRLGRDVCVYACMCIYIYIYNRHMYIYIYIHMYIHVNRSMCIHVHVYMDIHMRIHVCIYIYIYIYTHMCICIYIYICSIWRTGFSDQWSSKLVDRFGCLLLWSSANQHVSLCCLNNNLVIAHMGGTFRVNQMLFGLSQKLHPKSYRFAKWKLAIQIHPTNKLEHPMLLYCLRFICLKEQ